MLTSPAPRHAALLALALLGIGCTAEDCCLLRDGTEQIVLVEPPGRGVNDTTNAYVFHSIQAAIDATGYTATTICVTPGIYRENITLHGGVFVSGSGPSRTLLRPEHPRSGSSPVTIDETLVTLEAASGTTATLAGLSVGGAAVCIEARGAGSVLIEDVRVENCGVGLRAHDAGPMELVRTAAQGNRRAGLDLRDLPELSIAGPTDLDGNGRPDFLDGEDDTSLPSPLLDGLERSGAVFARGVDALDIRGLRVQANRFGLGQIVLRGSDGLVEDVVVQLRGIGEGGAGAAFAVSGGSLELRRVIARTQGQSLLRSFDVAPELVLDSVAWTDSIELRQGEAPGAPDPAFDLQGSGDISARHITLVGTGRAPAVDAPDSANLSVRNSILWGFDDVLRGAPGGEGFAWSLLSEADQAGVELVPSADPQLDPESNTFALLPSSPARCAGNPGVAAPVDLTGLPRPAVEGKTPDLGAVESAAPCPGAGR